MKQALLLHGTCDKEEYLSDKYPSLSNSHFFPWLQKELLMNGFLVQTPEMPTPYNPNYDEWKSLFERLISKDTSIIIGHSAGAGFMLKYLNEKPINLDKLVLVAPWLDPDKECVDFLSFVPDKNSLANIKEVHLLYSTDDMVEVLKTVDMVLNNYDNIKVLEFTNKGHFVSSVIGDKFPELLNICLE